MIDDHDIETIAAAFNQLRPDWPVSSLRTFIAKNLATRAKRDVVVALAWVACEPNTATPARVLEAGPWWKAAGVTGELTRRHPTPWSACHNCGRVYASGRGGYGAVVLGACCDNPTQRPAPSTDVTAHAQRAREAMRATNQGE